jgi:hypothetical protein
MPRLRQACCRGKSLKELSFRTEHHLRQGLRPVAFVNRCCSQQREGLSGKVVFQPSEQGSLRPSGSASESGPGLRSISAVGKPRSVSLSPDGIECRYRLRIRFRSRGQGFFASEPWVEVFKPPQGQRRPAPPAGHGFDTDMVAFADCSPSARAVTTNGAEAPSRSRTISMHRPLKAFTSRAWKEE